MGKKKEPMDDEFMVAPEQVRYDGPMPGTVRIMNLSPYTRDITLNDGTNVRLGPFARTGLRHVSGPILKKLLPPPVKKMVKRRELKLLEEVK